MNKTLISVLVFLSIIVARLPTLAANTTADSAPAGRGPNRGPGPRQERPVTRSFPAQTTPFWSRATQLSPTP